jgi:hypothetical protein
VQYVSVTFTDIFHSVEVTKIICIF